MSRLDEVASREWTAGHRLSLRIISAYQLKKRNLVAAYNITTLRMVFVDQEGSNGSLQWHRRRMDHVALFLRESGLRQAGQAGQAFGPRVFQDETWLRTYDVYGCFRRNTT